MPECKTAFQNYRAASTILEKTVKSKIFKSVVASAKRQHWKRRVEAMKLSLEAFQLMRWASPRRDILPPPLHHDGRFVKSQAECAEILKNSLLARHNISDDFPPCNLTSEGIIPWSYELAEREVKICTVGSGNTCPGADGISVELLETCWDSIGSSVTQIFRACLRLGYHPKCFKVAEVVFLPKTGQDPTTVKS